MSESLTFNTADSIKDNLIHFLQLDTDKQRCYLGELLYPLVQKNLSDAKKNLAPKITGMLIDLTVLEVSEILEQIYNEDVLKSRIAEAIMVWENYKED